MVRRAPPFGLLVALLTAACTPEQSGAHEARQPGLQVVPSPVTPPLPTASSVAPAAAPSAAVPSDGETKAATQVAAAPGPSGTTGRPFASLACVAGSEDSLAFVFVVDRSGSMSGQPIAELRGALSAALRTMMAETSAGIVAFDSIAQVLVPLRVRGGALATFDAGIDTLRPGGGTDGFVALELAFQMLHDVPSRRRHVLFMTDGMMPAAGLGALATAMKGCGIQLSTVGVGPNTDTATLEMLSRIGGGTSSSLAGTASLGEVFRQRVRLAEGRTR